MGIKEIKVDGTKFYEVKVHVQSKLNRKLRAQRKRSKIRTLREAQLTEKRLIQECAAEVARLEGSGLPWGELLNKYELLHRNGDMSFRRVQLSTIWDCIATLRRFTGSWEKRYCNEITVTDIRKLLQEMLDQGYSRSRIRTVKSSINTIFRWGIEEGAVVGIRTSPATVVPWIRHVYLR